MTVQIKDTIIYQEEHYPTRTNILSLYFRKNPEKKPKIKTFFSALMRGYTCTSEIVDQKLYIRSLDVVSAKPHGKLLHDGLKKVFPNPNDHFLDWFNGILMIETEPNPDHPDSYRGFPIHEVIQLLEIRKGIHTHTRTFTYNELEEFRQEQFELFKLSSCYSQLRLEEIESIEEHNKIRRSIEENPGQFSLRTFKESNFEHTISLQLFHHMDRFY